MSTPETDRPGEATVRRFLDRERDLLVARGEFGALFAAFMRQGLGAAVLHLATRPKGELVGWTIQVHRPPTNVFLTGDSAEAIVTGRVFIENVRPSDHSRMYVQTSRPANRTSHSTIEVFGVDILEMFERFYQLSEQRPARFFEIADDSFLMLQSLPEGDPAWLAKLSREEALGIGEDELKSLGDTTFRFRCGCDPDRMLDVVRSMFRSDPEELFRGDPGVEISCPRCGRRWWIDRARFENPSEKRGGAEG
jgi:molecular chaperone Hsp33